MKPAVYLRVSTKEQDVAAQRQVIEKWLAGNGIAEARWFIDHGVSGTTLDRKAMKELQRAIFHGEVNVVVVYALDRLARTALEGINLLHDWLERGVRLVVVTLQMDLSGDVGQMVASLLFHLAQMERNRTRERQRAGIDAARTKVQWAKELHQTGLTLARIAQRIGAKPASVQRMLDTPDNGVWWGGRGTGGHRKASPEQAYEYRRQSLSFREIARLLSINVSTAKRYVDEYATAHGDAQTLPARVRRKVENVSDNGRPDADGFGDFLTSMDNER